MRVYVVHRPARYAPQGVRVLEVHGGRLAAELCRNKWAAHYSSIAFDVSVLRAPTWTFFHWDLEGYLERRWNLLPKVTLGRLAYKEQA